MAPTPELGSELHILGAEGLGPISIMSLQILNQMDIGLLVHRKIGKLWILGFLTIRVVGILPIGVVTDVLLVGLDSALLP